MKLYVGTSGYAYSAWKGSFYPDHISGGQMLMFYARCFNTVEINNTFYRMPKPENIKGWVAAVPPGFLFSIKVPRRITHRKSFDDVGSDLAYFLETVKTFDPHLGALLFQFPKTVEPDPGRLQEILRRISPEQPCAFEFRSSVSSGQEIKEILEESGACLCTSDTNENPQSAIAGNASWGYLRLRRSDYSGQDLEKWHDIIVSQKWDKAFLFFKHEEAGLAPRYVSDFKKISDETLCLNNTHA